jgi:hypothetical protein
MFTLPADCTVKYCVPEVEATANGLSVVVPCTRNAVVADVALTPDTVPLSRSVPIPRLSGDVQSAANPVVPPVIPRPSVDVATHFVVVPVVWRTIPRVPVLFVES